MLVVWNTAPGFWHYCFSCLDQFLLWPVGDIFFESSRCLLWGLVPVTALMKVITGSDIEAVPLSLCSVSDAHPVDIPVFFKKFLWKDTKLEFLLLRHYCCNIGHTFSKFVLMELQRKNVKINERVLKWTDTLATKKKPIETLSEHLHRFSGKRKCTPI